jgi:hypothetical protein
VFRLHWPRGTTGNNQESRRKFRRAGAHFLLHINNKLKQSKSNNNQGDAPARLKLRLLCCKGHPDSEAGSKDGKKEVEGKERRRSRARFAELGASWDLYIKVMLECFAKLAPLDPADKASSAHSIVGDDLVVDPDHLHRGQDKSSNAASRL